MAVCPHCQREFENAKRHIFCPHCRRTPIPVAQCAQTILNSGQLESLLQKATDEYWKTITTGLKHIMIMDEQTCLDVCRELFDHREDT